MTAWIELLLGAIFLILGGEFLVRGGVSLAKKFRISSLVIGMTIVAFGTSAPELLVSLEAALSGHPEISIGNVVGSNIANIGLILGLSALLNTITVEKPALKTDIPVMIGASIIFLLFSLDSKLGRIEGIIFIIMMITFPFYQFRSARKGIGGYEVVENVEETNHKHPPMIISILIVILSCISLTFGADALINGATEIAHRWNVSEKVIAITIVAFGTSLPELVTSMIAAIRKQSDIAIGNIVGSNIFNILSILGITATIQPIPLGDRALFLVDILIMIAFSVLMYVLVIIKKPYNLAKIGGSILFIAYAIYVTLLFMGIV